MTITSVDIQNRIAELRTGEEEFCLATVVRTQNATSAKAGAKAVVTHAGEIYGFVGGSCVHGAVKRVAEEVLTSGLPRLIRVKPKDEVIDRLDADGVELHKSSCPSGGTVDLFIEPMLLAPRCIVCGASPVAAALVLLAATMGYRTVVAALRADHDQVAGANLYIDGFDLNSIEPNARDVIIVATQGKRDREALQAALSSDAEYVALVGSRKKAATLKAEIADKGIAPERLGSLHAPAGLDIGAIEPEEIALSIIGEIVRHRRQKLRQSAADDDSMKQQAS